MYDALLPPCIKGIILINLWKLVQQKSNDKFKIFLGSLAMSAWWDCYHVLGNLHVSQKYMQKIPSTIIRTWGITNMKNGSSAHHFLSSVWNYFSVKTRIISKPLKWFPKRINWLVSIWSDFTERYFQTDYNILWVQVDVHCPVVSQVIILEWKWFFFLPGVQAMCAGMFKYPREKIWLVPD